MNLIRILVFWPLLIFNTVLYAATPQYEWVREKSKLEFISSTKLFDVTGSFSDWKVSANQTGTKLTDIKVVVTINSASLDTDNSSRDEHLKSEEFFWVEKYPNIVFESTKIAQSGPGIFLIEGELKFRGITKKLQFDAKVEGNFRITGELTLNRQDFGITYKSFFLLPSIRDSVLIRFDLYAKAKPAT